MLSDQERQEIEALDDGESFKLDDGRTIRFKVELDDTNPFDDYDCYGKIAWVGRGYRENRPDGFDGNAEKLQANRSDQVWWQPPADVKRTDPGFAKFRRQVTDLLEFGMCGYVLELCDGKDAYGRDIVVDVQSLWGIEPFAEDSYRVEIIGELLSEMEL